MKGGVPMASFGFDKGCDEECTSFLFVSSLRVHNDSDVSMWSNRVHSCDKGE